MANQEDIVNRKLQLIKEEELLCKCLSSKNLKIRIHGISSLSKWINKNEKAVDVEDFIRIWNGIVCFLQMSSNNPVVQEDAAKRVSCVIHSINDTKVAMLFVRGYFETVENSCDRMNDYMMFMRRFLRQVLAMLENSDWELEKVKLFSAELYNAIQIFPFWLAHQFNETFTDQVVKISGGHIPTDALIVLLEGFAECIVQLKPSVEIINDITTNVFGGLSRQLTMHLKQKAAFAICDKENRMVGEDESNEKTEEEYFVEVKVLKPRSEGINVYLPHIDFDENKIIAFLMDCLDKSQHINKASSIINELIEMFNGLSGLRKLVLSSERDVCEMNTCTKRMHKIDESSFTHVKCNSSESEEEHSIDIGTCNGLIAKKTSKNSDTRDMTELEDSSHDESADESEFDWSNTESENDYESEESDYVSGETDFDTELDESDELESDYESDPKKKSKNVKVVMPDVKTNEACLKRKLESQNDSDGEIHMYKIKVDPISEETLIPVEAVETRSKVLTCPGVKKGTLYHTGNGYYYRKIGIKCGKIFLQCVIKTCNARASTNCKLKSGIITSAQLFHKFHNHQPNLYYEQVEAMKGRIIERCRTETTPNIVIFREEIKSACPEVMSQLRYPAFVRTMQRARQASQPPPPVPLATYVDALQGTARYSKLEQEKIQLIEPTEIRCHHCYKTFLKTPNLNKHLRKVHKEYPISKKSTQKKEVKCWHCDKMYSKKSDLNKHLRNLHKLAMKYRAPTGKTTAVTHQEVFTCRGPKGGMLYHIQNGYYFKKSGSRRNTLFLQCVVNRCGARAVTDRNLKTWIISSTQSLDLQHNHQPEPYFEQVEALKRRILERCRTESTSKIKIFKEETQRVSEEVASRLKLKSFARTMDRVRAGSRSAALEAFANDMRKTPRKSILRRELTRSNEDSILMQEIRLSNEEISPESEEHVDEATIVEVFNMSDDENEEQE